MRNLHSNNRKTYFPLLFTALLEPKLMVKYTMANFLFVAAAVMGNASDFVKSRADYVTNDVDEDGIANAIARFVFDKGL